MLPTDYKLHHEIQEHPLEKTKILENTISLLMAWNQDEKLMRENMYDKFRSIFKIVTT